METSPDASTQLKAQFKSGKEIMEAQHERGRRVVEKNPWANEAFNLILERCPHVAEFDVVRLFDGKSQSHEEFIVGAALFKEYNALNPPSLPRAKRVIPVYRPPPKEAPPEPPSRALPRPGRSGNTMVKPAKHVPKSAKAALKPAKARLKSRKGIARAERPKRVRPKARPTKKSARVKSGARRAKKGGARRR